MNGKHQRSRLLAAILMLVVGGGVPWAVMRAQTAGTPVSGTVADKILQYIRNRFGVPDTVKLSLGPMHPSTAAAGFNETAVTVDDGKTKRLQQTLVSKDSRYLIVVPAFGIIDLHQNSPVEMVQRIREAFKVPPDRKLSLGGFKPSLSSEFKQGTLTVDDGMAHKQDVTVLLSQDGRHLIVGELYSLGVDLRQVALHTIALNDEPSQGPSSAPVTIVEYADLQCPTCARMHDFLENRVEPRYGNKVRVVFKEFPLVGIHDWSFTAAIADQCAYEINQAAYVPMRSAIFRNQQLINITNLRETLLSYGEEAGVDRVKLAGCMDAKSSLPRVQRDMAEAKRINVNQTPTVFINGRMLMGLPSEDAYYQAIDEALRGK